jgi:uncharacterized membrane protein HdeD (DUF308 family)
MRDGRAEFAHPAWLRALLVVMGLLMLANPAMTLATSSGDASFRDLIGILGGLASIYMAFQRKTQTDA